MSRRAAEAAPVRDVASRADDDARPEGPRLRDDLRAVRRILPLLGLRRRTLAAAVALGSLTLAASVALAGTSAWLIVRASQMPPVMTLNIAAVGVRLFGVLRGVSRYLDRLASHDVALRGVA
ncbi:MAG: thiol reductant ABC exporter subunit CydC, partial [Salana multivorans]|nr:thiol reductant ABC exporter subunit CydC [Salana multivorans]